MKPVSGRTLATMATMAVAILAPCFVCNASANDSFDVAITIDDLPGHGLLAPGMTRLTVAQAHLRLLKEHKVPQVFGFVNAGRLKDEPESEPVLDAWRKAGYPLGNHTYSHMNLARAPSLEAWKADVIAGETVINTRMQGEDWRFLRLPNLAAGAYAKPAFAWLQAQGYRIADVSLSFADSAYKESYARCLAKGDTKAIEAMQQHYFADVDDGIARMKADSKRVYGRIIPQVLLAHLGAWGADTLSEVLSRLTAAGARYVTLAQAQSDPAYADIGGGTIISRAAKAKGIPLGGPDRPVRARLDVDMMCR